MRAETLYRKPPQNGDPMVIPVATQEQFEIVRLKEEIEPTDFQKGILSELNEASSDFCVENNLLPHEFSLENLRVIEVKKFDRLKKRAGSHELTDSFFYNDDIYIKNSDKIDFFKNLSHAMIHAFSASKKIVLSKSEMGTSFIHTSQYDLQNGFELSNEQDKVLGRGLNEATTEIAAGFLREYCYIDASEKHDITKELYYYLPQICVVDELAELMNPNEAREAYFDLIRGQIEGGPAIWRLLRQTFSDRGIDNGLKILLQMDLSIDSAMDTAKKLGLLGAVEKIKQLHKKNNSKEN